MEKLLQKYCQNPLKQVDIPMELRLYRFICLIASACIFLVILPTNFLQHISVYSNLIIFGFGVFTLALYRASCRGEYHVKLLFAMLMIVLSGTWFFNGGSEGSVSYFFFTAFTYPVIFLRGKERWLALGTAMSIGIVLIGSEALWPHLVVPFLTPEARHADLIVGILTSGTCCTAMLWVVLSHYDAEHSRLRSLNEELAKNIAERREAAQQLLKTQRRLDALVAGTPDAVYVREPDGNVALLNEAARSLMERFCTGEKGEAEGKPAHLGAAFLARGDDSVLGSGTTITFQNCATLADGSRRTFLTTKGPLLDAGKITGIFGIARDVTELDEVTEHVRRLNEELDRRVTERTEQLERAIREQESFSYSVSHDLRTPLRHINSYTTILREESGAKLDPEGERCLEQICKASRHMGKLIDDLLELSRVSRSKLAVETVNLTSLALLSSLMLRQSDNKRRAEFDIAPDITALGDKTLLTLVIENLFGNAWKYTSRREKARISFGRERVNGQEVFFVRDNGAGFDMAYKDKLFGAFERLHGVEYEGTGIGLATVKRIIERHRGSIWAEAKPDHGACFFFTLCEPFRPPFGPDPDPWRSSAPHPGLEGIPQPY